MHRFRLTQLAKVAMSAQRRAASNTTHVLPNGKVIDPATDKNLANWTISPVDIGDVYFNNKNLQYFSYDPPRGFTAEEIMQFSKEDGEEEWEWELTIERVRELIKMRDESKKGTLHTRIGEHTIAEWEEEYRALKGK